MIIANYKCCNCGYYWEQKPQPVICGMCGSEFVEWCNYEELYEKYFKYSVDGIMN